MLASVKAKQLQRRARFKEKYPSLDMDTIDDKINYELHREAVETKVDIHVYNHSDAEDLLKFFRNEPRIGLMRYRPGWDEYFMKVAHVVRERSNCMKRSVGSVVVVDNQIIATGYNGTPSALKNCNEFGCGRCNENISQGKLLDKCRCIHAEENSLLFCGIVRAKGGTVYVTLFPCLWCAKIIVQAGIKRVVYDEEYNPEYSGAEVLKDGGVEVEKCPVIDLTYKIPKVKDLLGWLMEDEHNFKVLKTISSVVPAIECLTNPIEGKESPTEGEEESKTQDNIQTNLISVQQDSMTTNQTKTNSSNKVENFIVKDIPQGEFD